MYKVVIFFLSSIICTILLIFFVHYTEIVSSKKSQINIDVSKYEIKADGYTLYMI